MDKPPEIPSEELIEELVRDKLEGISYSVIRARLSARGMTPEQIRSLIRQVDEKVLQAATSEGGSIRARQWYRGGFALAIGGLLVAVAFNAGLILEGRPALLVYSPFIAGILVMFYGRMLQRRNPGSGKERPGAIRRKRPFK